jgi:hypothetical protein
MTPHAAMVEMIDIINALQDIYVQETAALKKSDISAFLALQDKKLSAARLYEQGITQILNRKQDMKTVDPSLKAKLNSMQAKFSILAHENRKALERMQRTTNRLGEIIRDAAQKAIKGRTSTSYTAAGYLHDHKRGNMSVGIQETA